MTTDTTTQTGAVALTGWERLDPLVALAVAANIVYSGFGLVRRSALGLMDTALPPADYFAINTDPKIAVVAKVDAKGGGRGWRAVSRSCARPGRRCWLGRGANGRGLEDGRAGGKPWPPPPRPPAAGPGSNGGRRRPRRWCRFR